MYIELTKEKLYRVLDTNSWLLPQAQIHLPTAGRLEWRGLTIKLKV